MSLPAGKILLNKKLKRTEYVGVNDTITEEMTGFLYYNTKTNMIELYQENPLFLIGEMALEDLLKVTTKEIRVQILKALAEKEYGKSNPIS
jgi:hypothetical protein